MKGKSGRPALGRQEIAFYDLKTRGIKRIRKDKFSAQLDKVIATLKASLDKAGKIDNFSLESIDISLGVSAGIVVVTVEGGIGLHYTHKYVS